MRDGLSTSCTTSSPSGRLYGILYIVDDVTRECLALIPDTSISGKWVARELSALTERRARPA